MAIFHANKSEFHILKDILVISLMICLSNSSFYENHVIPAAIETRYSLDVRPFQINNHHPIQPQVVRVDGTQLSFIFKFKSSSSNINVIHKHDSAKAPAVQQSNSVDEPHILSHTVNRPIIQEIRELISPYRRVIQQIEPVQQHVQTIVATGQSKKPDQDMTHDMTGGLSYMRRKPLIESIDSMDTTFGDNFVDNSLYSGTSLYDLKYVSPNIEILNNGFNRSNNYLYETMKLYRDRK